MAKLGPLGPPVATWWVWALTVCLAVRASAHSQLSPEVPVFGCFDKFPSEWIQTLGYANSNVRCQRECRERGYMLAATYACTACCCGSQFPQNATTDDKKCLNSCGEVCVPQPDKSLQASCGSLSEFVVSGVGELDPMKDVLRQLGRGWRSNRSYRDIMVGEAKKYKNTPPVGRNVTLRNVHFNLCLLSNSSVAISQAGCTGSTEQHWYLRRAEGYKDHYNVVSHITGRCLVNHGWDNVHAGLDCQDTERFRWQVHQSLYLSEASWYLQDNNNHDKHCLYLRQENKNNYKTGTYWCYQYDQKWKISLVNANDADWFSQPELSLSIKRPDGQVERCSILADDSSYDLESFKCRKITQDSINLRATTIEVIEATPLPAGLPEVLGEMECDNSQSTMPILCTRKMQVTYEVSSGYRATTAVSSSVSNTHAMEVKVRAGIPIFNTQTTATLKKVTQNSKAFTSTEMIEEKTSISHTYSTSIIAKAGTVAKLKLVREKQDVTFRWEAKLHVLGEFEVNFPNWYDHSDAVSRLVTKDHIKAFGIFTYPDVDRIKSIVTNAVSWEVQQVDDQDF